MYINVLDISKGELSPSDLLFCRIFFLKIQCGHCMLVMLSRVEKSVQQYVQHLCSDVGWQGLVISLMGLSPRILPVI